MKREFHGHPVQKGVRRFWENYKEMCEKWRQAVSSLAFMILLGFVEAHKMTHEALSGQLLTFYVVFFSYFY